MYLHIRSKDPKNYSQMKRKWSNRTNYLIGNIMNVAEEIAREMPELDLPRMTPKARNAFREVLDSEQPRGNGSTKSILQLAQARGYCAHPCDWVPSSEGDHQFPKLYEQWAIWLAEEGYTPFYVGVPLTAQNWECWKPVARTDAFRHLCRTDRQAAYHLLLTMGTTQPATTRLSLLGQLSEACSFPGIYPSDAPIMKHFLNDRSEKVRALAQKDLDTMEGWETEEAHAKVVAEYFEVASDRQVILSPEILKARLARHVFSTNLDVLAGVLGLTVKEVVTSFDLQYFAGVLYSLFLRIDDAEAKKVLAKRLTEAGKDCPPKLLRDAEPDVWEKALNVSSEAEYPSAVLEFLGIKAGTLNTSQVRKIRHYRNMEPSVKRELETGKLPVNNRWDPLRILALVASKSAAEELLGEAMSAGIEESNPRLSMLKYNLAL